MVVLIEDADSYRALAEEIAADRDERVVAELPDADETEPVIYVADPGEIREERLVELQRRLSASDGDGRFSVVTGFTVEYARRLYEAESSGSTETGSSTGAEAQSSGGSDHVLALRSEPGDLPTDPGQHVLAGDSSTAEALAEAADGVESLSIQTGGWPMHLFLGDGLLCGVPETRPLDGGADEPYCVADGEIDCPLSGDLVRAESLDADHVFVSSCASMIDNASTGRSAHVGLSLMSGARSAIGAYRVGPTLPHEALLHYCLLRDGYDLVERCYLLNRNARACDIKAYPYVPFGRPDSALDSSGRYEVSVDTDDGLTLRVSDVDAHVVDATIPAADVPDGDTHYLRNVTPGYDGPPLYYATFEEGDGLRVLAYAGQRLRRDELDLQITTRPPNADERLQLQDAVRTVSEHRRLGVYDGKTAEQATKFQNLVGGFASEFEPESYEVAPHSDGNEMVTEAVQQFEAIRERLLDAATDVGFLTSLYSSNAGDDEVFFDDDTCPYCDRPTFANRVSDFLGSTYRQINECPQCGPISDAPVEDGAALTPPTVRVESVEGDSRLVSVELTNDRDVPVTATVAPEIPSPSPDADSPLFRPERKQRTLAPGEDATFEFALRADSLEPSEYSIRVVALANLRLYESRRPTQVGSVTGQIPFYRT